MRKFSLIIGIVTYFLLLQSCLVTKKYEGVEHVTQEKLFRGTEAAGDTTSIATLSWKEIFTDPSLQLLINHAIENNVSNLVMMEQIKAAEAYLKQGRAMFYPSLNAGVNYNYYSISRNGPQGNALPQNVSNYLNLFDLSANASWEADIWGKIKSQKNALDAAYMQSLAAQKVIQTQLISGVAVAYYQLLALDEDIRVTKETIELRKTSWETTQSLKDAGVGTITSTAVQQTHSQYLDAQVLLLDLEKQVHLLENTICILMGDEPHNIERSTLSAQRINTNLNPGIPIQLLSNRPDVAVAESEYRQMFEMVNVARANFYPALTIGLGGGFQSLQITNWLSPNSILSNITGGIMAPVLNQRKIKTNYEVSIIQREQARLNFQGVLIQASKEVSDALYQYKTASDKITLQSEQQRLLNQSVKDSQELLSSGFNNFSYLEVLNAQQNALNIGLAVIDSKVSQLISMVNLYHALGGGAK